MNKCIISLIQLIVVVVKMHIQWYHFNLIFHVRAFQSLLNNNKNSYKRQSRATVNLRTCKSLERKYIQCSSQGLREKIFERSSRQITTWQSTALRAFRCASRHNIYLFPPVVPILARSSIAIRIIDAGRAIWSHHLNQQKKIDVISCFCEQKQWCTIRYLTSACSSSGPRISVRRRVDTIPNAVEAIFRIKLLFVNTMEIY